MCILFGRAQITRQSQTRLKSYLHHNFNKVCHLCGKISFFPLCAHYIFKGCVCKFMRILQTPLLTEWLGSFICHCTNGHQMWVCTKSYRRRRKFSQHSYWKSNLQPLIVSLMLYQLSDPNPYALGINWQAFCSDSHCQHFLSVSNKAHPSCMFKTHVGTLNSVAIVQHGQHVQKSGQGYSQWTFNYGQEIWECDLHFTEFKFTCGNLLLPFSIIICTAFCGFHLWTICPEKDMLLSLTF